MQSYKAAAFMVALGVLAIAAPAKANVTYRWSDPGFTEPFTDASIVVTDAASRSGSLTFESYCGSTFPPCAPDPPSSGWVSGFEFPAYDSVAYVDLSFEHNFLSGSIYVGLTSDQGWKYEGSGHDWTATFIDGPETYTETGFYLRAIPEPATLALLGIGILGLATVRGRKQRSVMS
jgi:hypothetical protein